MQSRWERRDRKLRKRREAMQASGAGLKKILLPLFAKQAAEVEQMTRDRERRPATSRAPGDRAAQRRRGRRGRK